MNTPYENVPLHIATVLMRIVPNEEGVPVFFGDDGLVVLIPGAWIRMTARTTPSDAGQLLRMSEDQFIAAFESDPYAMIKKIKNVAAAVPVKQ